VLHQISYLFCSTYGRKQADVFDSVFAEQKVLDSPLWAAKINAVEKKEPMRKG
jgi:hypothetical protein